MRVASWTTFCNAAATTKEIADDAGVNEATNFRRYGSEADLIVAALRAYPYPSAFGRLRANGDLPADASAIARAYRDTFAACGGAVLTLLSEVPRHPELVGTAEVMAANLGAARVILDGAERRLIAAGIETVTIRGCARDSGVSAAAPVHHFGSLKGVLSALAARGFGQLVARLDADLAACDRQGAAVLVGAYVAFAVASPHMFDLMWREDVLNPDDGDLARARRITLERLRAQSQPPTVEGEGRVRAIRIWSLAHGLTSLLLSGRVVTALGGAGTGLETSADFVALAYDSEFSER